MVWTNNVGLISNSAMHFHGNAGDNNYIDTGSPKLFRLYDQFVYDKAYSLTVLIKVAPL